MWLVAVVLCFPYQVHPGNPFSVRAGNNTIVTVLLK